MNHDQSLAHYPLQESTTRSRGTLPHPTGARCRIRDVQNSGLRICQVSAVPAGVPTDQMMAPAVWVVLLVPVLWEQASAWMMTTRTMRERTGCARRKQASVKIRLRVRAVLLSATANAAGSSVMTSRVQLRVHWDALHWGASRSLLHRLRAAPLHVRRHPTRSSCLNPHLKPHLNSDLNPRLTTQLDPHLLPEPGTSGLGRA